MPASEVGCKESLAFIGICLDIITLPPSAQKPGIINCGYSVTLFSIQHLVPKLSIHAPRLNQKKPTRKQIDGGSGAIRFTPEKELSFGDFLCLFFLFTLSSSSLLHSIRKLEITAPSPTTSLPEKELTAAQYLGVSIH